MKMSVKVKDIKIGDTIIIYDEEYFVFNIVDKKGLFDEDVKEFSVYYGYEEDTIRYGLDVNLDILRNVSNTEMDMPDSDFFEWYFCSICYNDDEDFPRFIYAKSQSEYGMSRYEYIHEYDNLFLEDCEEFWKKLNSKDYKFPNKKVELMRRWIEKLNDNLISAKNMLQFTVRDMNEYNSL